MTTTQTRIKYVVQKPKLGTVGVDCSANVQTTIHALKPISDWGLGNGLEYRLRPSSNDAKVRRVHSTVANPHFTTVQFLSGTQWITLELQRAADGVKPVSNLIFVRFEEDIPELEVISVDHPCSPLQDFLAFIADAPVIKTPVHLRWSDQGHRMEAAIGAMRWASDDDLATPALVFCHEHRTNTNHVSRFQPVPVADLRAASRCRGAAATGSGPGQAIAAGRQFLLTQRDRAGSCAQLFFQRSVV